MEAALVMRGFGVLAVKSSVLECFLMEVLAIGMVIAEKMATALVMKGFPEQTVLN